MKATLVLLSVLCLTVTCLSGQSGPHSGEERLKLFLAAEAATEARQDSAARALYRATLMGPDGTEIADSLTALAYHRIATGYYNAEQDTLAMPYFRRSLALRDRLFLGPHNERAHVRTNMGMSMYYYGDLDSATLLVQEANALYEQLERPDTLFWIQSLNELGAQALVYRDYSLGYASSYRAVELCRRLKSVTAGTFFDTHYGAARVLYNFGDVDVALEYARTALSVLDPQEHYPLALCHNLIALILREKSDSLATLEHLWIAVKHGNRYPDDPRPLADSHLYLAEQYAMDGNESTRDRHATLARQLYQRAGMLSAFYSRIQLPQFAAERGNYPAALKLLDETVRQLQSGADEEVNTQLTVQQINALLLRADVLSRTTQIDRALADYQEAFRLQDYLRQQATDPVSRRYLSSDLRPNIDRAVHLLHSRYRQSGRQADLWQAFQLSERARAFSLLAGLQKTGIDQKIQNLQARIALLERKVVKGEEEFQSELESCRITLASLQRSGSDLPLQVMAVDRGRLSAYLAERRTYLMEYHLSDSLNLVYLLSPVGELSVFPLDSNHALPQLISQWVEVISESAFRRKSLLPRERQNELDSLFFTRGRELTGLLLPADLRQALPPGARICIVPDGSLSYLPFAALPLDSTAPDTFDYQKLSYFQDNAKLSYAYSAAFLARIGQENGRTYQDDLLAFAPSFGTTEPAAMARSVADGDPLRPLLFNGQESKTITTLVKDAQLYLGVGASRERFMEKIGSSRILHLSTHGVVDPVNPELSFVAFSQTGGSPLESQLLYFNDLLGLRIDNELTVLSACETSLGKIVAGETAMSFASAFAAAGARSTLTTLWQVDDRATRDLMVAFYRYLLAGEDRVNALSKAQNTLRKADFFHPYFWSAPTLYGMTGPVRMGDPSTLGSSISGSYWILGCAALLVLFAFYRIRI